eukprot:jgi/Botrbrau1/12452/Bobra.0094s0015.1
MRDFLRFFGRPDVLQTQPQPMPGQPGASGAEPRCTGGKDLWDGDDPPLKPQRAENGVHRTTGDKKGSVHSDDPHWDFYDHPVKPHKAADHDPWWGREDPQKPAKKPEAPSVWEQCDDEQVQKEALSRHIAFHPYYRFLESHGLDEADDSATEADICFSYLSPLTLLFRNSEAEKQYGNAMAQRTWTDAASGTVATLLYTAVMVLCMKQYQAFNAGLVGIAAAGAACAGVYQFQPKRSGAWRNIWWLLSRLLLVVSGWLVDYPNIITQNFTKRRASFLFMQSLLQLLLPAILPVRFFWHIITLLPLLWSALAATSRACNMLAASGAPPDAWDRSFGVMYSLLSEDPAACLRSPGGPWWSRVQLEELPLQTSAATADKGAPSAVPAEGPSTVPAEGPSAAAAAAAATAPDPPEAGRGPGAGATGGGSPPPPGESLPAPPGAGDSGDGPGTCPSQHALCLQGHTFLLIMYTVLGCASVYLWERRSRLQFASEQGFLVEPYTEPAECFKPAFALAIVVTAGGFVWKGLEQLYKE